MFRGNSSMRQVLVASMTLASISLTFKTTASMIRIQRAKQELKADTVSSLFEEILPHSKRLKRDTIEV